MKRTTLMRAGALAGLTALAAGSSFAQPPGFGGGGSTSSGTILGTDCAAPPIWHCPAEHCESAVVTQPGNTVEPQTRRTFFLDCPAGYEPGDNVTLLLSLHGGGSYANWQRNYAPFFDHKDDHNLVIMTPGSPYRVWGAEDDAYLENIVSMVVEAVGKENVDRFILAGHSQGGATSSRLVCQTFWRDKVDVRISLSGGRVGPTAGGRGFGGLNGAPVYMQDPDNPPAAPAAGGAPRGRGLAGPSGPPGGDCDYSFIFTNGEYESIPAEDSPLADKFDCDDRARLEDVVDPVKGYVWDSTRQDPGSDGWGHYPRSGRAQVFVYPNCNDGRVVADVVRLQKGHTEGLEPNVTETLVELALREPGGKIRNGSWDPAAD